jgi:hypothetical protein
METNMAQAFRALIATPTPAREGTILLTGSGQVPGQIPVPPSTDAFEVNIVAESFTFASVANMCPANVIDWKRSSQTDPATGKSALMYEATRARGLGPVSHRP